MHSTAKPPIFLLAVLATFAPLSIDLLLPALPSIADEFGSSASEVQLSISLFLLGFAIGQLINGPLYDHFKRKLVLISCLSIYLLCSLLCTLIESTEWLIVLRFVQGFGGAACAVIGRAILQDSYPQRVARIMSFTMLFATIVSALAPIVGSAIVNQFGWSAVFMLMSLYSLLTLSSVIIFVEDNKQYQSKSALSFKRILKHYWQLLCAPKTLLPMLCGGFIFAGLFNIFTAMPFLLTQHYFLNNQQLSYVLSASVLMMMLGSLINGLVLKRFDIDFLIPRALVVSSLASCSVLVCSIFDAGGLWGVILPLLFYTLVVGSIGANTMVAVMRSAPSLTGTASAIAGASRFVFGSLCGVILSMFDNASPLAMAVLLFCCTLFAVISYRQARTL